MDRLGVHQFADVRIAVLAGLAEERGSELGGPASTRLERSCWIGLGRTVASTKLVRDLAFAEQLSAGSKVNRRPMTGHRLTEVAPFVNGMNR